MKKRKKSARKRLSDDALQGPPARETVWLRGDAERLSEEELRQSPDEEFRPSGEILEQRDRKRLEQED